MAKIRNNIEKRFENFGLFITRYPKSVLLGVVLLLALMISNVPNIKMDTSSEGFLHPDDPTLIEYNRFRDSYGRDDKAVVAIKTDDVFTKAFLQKLIKLHNEIESSVPYVKNVDSLVNARNTRGEGDELIVEDLLESFPETKEEMKELRQRAMDSVFYKNLLLSEDGTLTTIIVETVAYSGIGKEEEDEFGGFEEEEEPAGKREYLSDKENSTFVNKLTEVVKKYEGENFKIQIAGNPVVTNDLKTSMSGDMQKFMRLGILLMLIILFIMFRRVTGVLYPLLVIILTLLSTVGMMAFMGVAFKLPTQILPSLLLAVSIGATVHILAIFYRKFNETKDKAGAISYTLGHSGLAIFMTSLTTALGVGSFSGAEVAPISDMGKFAAFGVMLSFFLTVTLLPALLQITPMKPKEVFSEKKGGAMDRFLLAIASIPINHTKKVIGVSGLLVVISLFAASGVKLSHNPIKWFPEDNAVRIATTAIDKDLKGSVTIEAILDTKKENGWYEPKLLKTLEKTAKEIEGFKNDEYFVGKTITISTIVKEINRALNENREEEYKIPDNKDLIAQEFLLFSNSGSDDLEKITNSSFSETRMTVKVPFLDAVTSKPLLDRVENKLKESFEGMDVTITGLSILFNRTLGAAVHSAVTSYVIAFVTITFMMIFMMGSIRIGLLSMIPNLAPIILGLSWMYLFSIPLDMFTLLIGSIAIGMVVDDTIHFFHNYQRYYRESRDAKEAIEHTFLTTGRALMITTIVLVGSFLIYLLATMISVQNFGFLTGFMIAMALVGDLLLTPALMIIISKKGWIK